MIKVNDCSIVKFKFYISGYDESQIYMGKVDYMLKNGFLIPKKEDDYVVIVFWQREDNFEMSLNSVSFAQKCIDDGTWVIIE
jgi:hypothetical protein